MRTHRTTPPLRDRLRSDRAARQADAAALRAAFVEHAGALRSPMGVAVRAHRIVGWLARPAIWPALVLALTAWRVSRSRRRPGSAPRAVRGRGGGGGRTAHPGGAAVIAGVTGAWAARAWWLWRVGRVGWQAFRTVAPLRRPR
jgi:hypothetical protein